MLRAITLEEMRKLQLDLLKNFDDFCRKRNYKYFLSGGTLLGAIRHRGFIPWDDDIDVMMPRSDYERFIKDYSSPIYGLRIGKLGKGNSLYANLVDERTIIDNCDLDMDMGLYMDIFPIDGFPNNVVLRYIYCYFKELLIYVYEGSKMKFHPAQRYNDTDAGIFQWKKHIRTIVKYIFISLFRRFNTQKLAVLCDRVACMYDYDKANYRGVVLAESHHRLGLGEVVGKSVFEKDVEIKFEMLNLPAPIGYDSYLRGLYNDYMKLPPKDKQQTRHAFKVYWKDDC